MAPLPHLLLAQLENLSRANVEQYKGGIAAASVLQQLRALLSAGRHADVLQLVQQQRLVQVIGQAMKQALEQLFQHLEQTPIPNCIETSIEQLLAVMAVLFASRNKWGGANSATTSLLIARQLAESGALACLQKDLMNAQLDRPNRSSCNLQSCLQRTQEYALHLC
jgi:hypothetical protein